MVNGVAIASPLADGPTPFEEPIESRIGTAIASAATALCFAVLEQNGGGLDPKTREAGGSRIAEVVQLQLGHELGDHDFTRIAYREGKARLRQYLDGNFNQQHGAPAGEEAVDAILSELLEIVARVVAFERMLAH